MISPRLSKSLTRLILALLLGLLAPACMALSCRQGPYQQPPGGNTRQDSTITTPINVATGNLTRGKLLWRSQQYTVTVTCYDTDPTPATANGEDAYMYIDPLHQLSSIDPSIIVGVTYQGVDYSSIDNTSSKIDIGPATFGPRPNGGKQCRGQYRGYDQYCNKHNTFQIVFSIFVKASSQPPPANGKITSTADYKVFQIDGVGGLNQSTTNGNYSDYIDGLGNISFISCNPTIRVVANNGDYVDFGTLAANTATPGAIARTVPFNVEADTSTGSSGQDCQGKTLQANFSTSQVVRNQTTIIPVMDDTGQSATGIGITLSDAKTPGTNIQMNTTVPLGQIVQNGSVVTHTFNANLLWMSNTPGTGKFHADANIDVTFQ